MLGPVVKILLVLTAFAPVLLVHAFLRAVTGPFLPGGLVTLLLAIVFAASCVLVIEAAQRELQVIEPFAITQIRTSDQQVLAFTLTYLVPLVQLGPVEIDAKTMGFVLLILLFVVMTTHTYHFNPLLGLFGYHFYEVSTADGITYVLITRRDMRSKKDVNRVVLLTDYMVMEKKP